MFCNLDLSLFAGLLLANALLWWQVNLKKKSLNSSFLYPHASQKGCAASPIRRRSLFPYFLTLGCPCDLLWLADWMQWKGCCASSEAWSASALSVGTLPPPCGQGQASLLEEERLFGGKPSCHSQGILNQSTAS